MAPPSPARTLGLGRQRVWARRGGTLRGSPGRARTAGRAPGRGTAGARAGSPPRPPAPLPAARRAALWELWSSRPRGAQRGVGTGGGTGSARLGSAGLRRRGPSCCRAVAPRRGQGASACQRPRATASSPGASSHPRRPRARAQVWTWGRKSLAATRSLLV